MPTLYKFFRHDTIYYKNLYLSHLRTCRPGARNNLSNSNIPNVEPIRVNANNLQLNNILDNFGFETKKNIT